MRCPKEWLLWLITAHAKLTLRVEHSPQVDEVKHSEHRKATCPHRILKSFEQILRETEESIDDENEERGDSPDSDQPHAALRRLFAKNVLKQQFELVERAQQGDLAARDLLLRHCEPLTKYYASRWKRFEDDLIQEGKCVVLQAIKNFDKSQNVSFLSYAAVFVKRATIRYINDNRSSIRVPRYVRSDARKLERSAQQLSNELGRSATAGEIALDTELSDPKLVRKINEWADREVVSFESLYSEEGILDDDVECLLIDRLPEPDSVAEENECKEFVARILGLLNPRESIVMKLLAGLGDEPALTLEEIGERLHISKERVWQIKSAAFKKIRASSSEGEARQFLN